MELRLVLKKLAAGTRLSPEELQTIVGEIALRQSLNGGQFSQPHYGDWLRVRGWLFDNAEFPAESAASICELLSTKVDAPIPAAEQASQPLTAETDLPINSPVSEDLITGN